MALFEDRCCLEQRASCLLPTETPQNGPQDRDKHRYSKDAAHRNIADLFSHKSARKEDQDDDHHNNRWNAHKIRKQY